jgi:hypothetical protein
MIKINNKMKMVYIIIGLLLIVGIVFYFSGCIVKSKPTTKPQKKADSANNPYKDLRDLALNATIDQIGVKIPSNETKIYGVVMDWDVGEGIATLVAFLSGDASLYLSSGGGMIGGSGHDNIKQAAKAFINMAEKYLGQTTKTETTPLPDKDGVKFYFLTNNGKYVGKEQMKNFENNSSAWLNLFEEGNKLISEIRMTTEQK